MTKQEYIELEVVQYEQRLKEPLPAHNKSVLRSMAAKEFDWWESEEGRILNDNNRYAE